MRPALGWAGLSRSALNRAEAQLAAESDGVRDEVGVLTLHTAYANRFFPGTSVQQTRLRYALFVPWQIKTLLRDRERVQPEQPRRALECVLKQAELDLARRLPDVDGEGTIGRRTARAGSLAIPPSQSYWVALGAWGVLSAGPYGDTPARGALFSCWGRWSEGHRGRSATDDEGRALDSPRYLFHPGLPDPPAELIRDKPLDFKLLDRERKFLRARLLDTRRSGDGQPSLLSALVRSGEVIPDGSAPWSRSVIGHADEPDRRALRRARDAAALAAVTRAIYAAAVEALRERDDGSAVGERHRGHLAWIVDKYGVAAQRLRLEELPRDGVLIGDLEPVLLSVQQWLSQGGKDPLDEVVLAPLSSRELRRKGSRRAKLPLSAHGREARAAWRADAAALASPITYRWSVVRRFVKDLQE